MANKIRLGVIGAGGATWANRAHFPALAHNPDFELTAVCTTRPESAEAARQRLRVSSGGRWQGQRLPAYNT
mgnify:CR=1 FL=1